jgi:hypothetical protein
LSQVKKKSLKTLKTKAATLFQLYVRLRDTNSDGFGNCCSCGKWVFYNQADGGHFVSRSRLSTLFEERNVHIQCKQCNAFGGNPDGYALFIIKKYGAAEIERLNQLKHQTTKFTQFDYEVMITDFKDKIGRLMAEKDIE